MKYQPGRYVDCHPLPVGSGEKPRRNHRVGPWIPVMPVKVDPMITGGDKIKRQGVAPYAGFARKKKNGLLNRIYG